jgi:hypothetical protein
MYVHISRTISIFYGQSVYLYTFGMLYQEQSGIPAR